MRRALIVNNPFAPQYCSADEGNLKSLSVSMRCQGTRDAEEIASSCANTFYLFISVSWMNDCRLCETVKALFSSHEWEAKHRNVFLLLNFRVTIDREFCWDRLEKCINERELPHVSKLLIMCKFAITVNHSRACVNSFYELRTALWKHKILIDTNGRYTG